MYYAMYAKDFELEDLIFDHVAPVAYWTSIEEERILHPFNACKEREEYKAKAKDDKERKLYVDSNIGNVDHMFLVVPIICEMREEKLSELVRESKVFNSPFNDDGKWEERAIEDLHQNYRVVLNAIFAHDLNGDLADALKYGDKYYQPKEGVELPDIMQKNDANALWLRIRMIGLIKWLLSVGGEYGVLDHILLNASGSVTNPRLLLDCNAEDVEERDDKREWYSYHGLENLTISKKDLASIAIIRKDMITDQMARLAIR